MPWSCNACGTTVEVDDASCPQCAASKESWTVIQDQTRALVLPKKKKLRLLAGDLTDELPADDPAHASVEYAETEQAIAIEADEVVETHEDGERPAPADALRIEVTGSKATSATIEVLFETKPSDEVEVALAGEPPHATLLLTFGPDDLSAVSFPEVTVIDVSEETETGFAPTIEVAVSGFGPVELPVALQESFEFSV